jgi:DNA-binding response OmpR family regulator
LNSNLEILKSLNILYLEDEENIRKNITRTLQLICHKVYDCGDATAALEVYKNEKIDIILSDISMPKLNGIEFSKIIRKDNKKIPIILLTAHTDTDYLIEATKLKLVDYLTKPLNFTKLKQALNNAIDEIVENNPPIIKFENNIEYHMSTKQLYQNGIEKNITAKEIALLELLYKNKHKSISQDFIKLNLWEDQFDATDSALKAVLNKLRNKIGKNSIKNISGVGYRLITI